MAQSKATAQPGGGPVKKTGERESRARCVCGTAPCIVKHKNKYMLACPDMLVCSMRSRWATNEQAAITDWNVTVQAAKQEARRDT